MEREKRYRPNVAAVVLNLHGQILACERSDVDGAWQFPQGGVKEGEPLEEALVREVREEIGAVDFEIIGRLPDPIRYDWPPEHCRKGYHGQEQYYFLLRLLPGAMIDLHTATAGEFQRCRWMGSEEFRTGLRGFKAVAYLEALGRLEKLYPGLIAP